MSAQTLLVKIADAISRAKEPALTAAQDTACYIGFLCDAAQRYGTKVEPLFNWPQYDDRLRIP
jgi:hypothetical protein